VIDKLQFLLALARERHFGRAAQACGVTQPTLSGGIKQFEEMLGVVLVNRGSRFHSFTPEGERILEWARRIVGDAGAMRQEVRALKQGLTGHLIIAAVPPALAMVASLTVPYHARHPDVSFTVLTRTSTQISTLFENLEIDAGITYTDNEASGRLRTVPLYREQYCLLTAKASPLGDRREVTWGEVGQARLCLLTPDTQNRRLIDGYLEAAGAGSTPRLVSDSMIVLFAHVQSGQWSTVMPAGLVEALGLADQVSVIPIAGDAPLPTIGLIIPKREPLPPLTAALVVEARRLADRLYR
jgi:DNA-binding transcriptional LysR family regulator